MAYTFTPEMRERIRVEIEKRVPNLQCPLGHSGTKMQIAEAFAGIPLFESLWSGQRTSNLPSAAAVCPVCGYTMFFNLIVLGLKDAIGPDMDAMLSRIRRD